MTTLLRRGLVLLTCTALLGTFAGCNRQPRVKTALGPPLELRLNTHGNTFALDLGGQAAPAYRAELEAEQSLLRQKGPAFFQDGEKLKPAPTVHFELEIRNTTRGEVTFNVGGAGDDLDVRVEGPEVIRVIGPAALPGPFLPEQLRVKSITLAPGESYVQPLPRLEASNSFRTDRMYWTRPGHYRIVAIWHLPWMESAPGGLTLVSQPVQVQVQPDPVAPAEDGVQ